MLRTINTGPKGYDSKAMRGTYQIFLEHKEPTFNSINFKGTKYYKNYFEYTLENNPWFLCFLG